MSAIFNFNLIFFTPLSLPFQTTRSLSTFIAMESSVIILDNSEWNRNGDYFPTRFDAQRDASILLFDSKLRSNVENCVGLLLMAGSNPKVLITPTSERSKYENALFGKEACIQGGSDCISAVQIAQLALKHRTNKNHAQRIVIFVGSPLAGEATEEAFASLGKKLKKNGIAVDAVLFGDMEESLPLMTSLIDAVNNNGNSHLIVVSPPKNLREALLGTELLSGSGGNGSGNGGDGDMDMDADPELAMAIRLSLEEQARHAQPTETNGPSQQPTEEQPDEEMMQAIAMSLESSQRDDNNSQTQ